MVSDPSQVDGLRRRSSRLDDRRGRFLQISIELRVIELRIRAGLSGQVKRPSGRWERPSGRWDGCGAFSERRVDGCRRRGGGRIGGLGRSGVGRRQGGRRFSRHRFRRDVRRQLVFRRLRRLRNFCHRRDRFRRGRGSRFGSFGRGSRFRSFGRGRRFGFGRVAFRSYRRDRGDGIGPFRVGRG
jgi:hypothetical protein